MKTIIYFLILLFPIVSIGNTSTNETIFYPEAVSQTGRFKISNLSPLSIAIQESSKLTDFLAFRELDSQQLILIGSISSDKDLKTVCENPVFLSSEKIADLLTININDIRYFNTKFYSGCQINIDENRAVLIIRRPAPFVNQNGEEIKYVAVVSPKYKLTKLLDKITFHITANDFFISLLQISQAFSPFSQEIDWNTIKQQGLEWIGNQAEPCRGLSAAGKFLIPRLQQYDFHSFISLKGLGTESCPLPPITEDEDLQEWLSLPNTIRDPIIKYTSSFHGRELNGDLSYLYIPSIEAYDQKLVKQSIEEGRNALHRSNIAKNCGLIIDLRYNTGGNLQAMLLTLGGILPEGKLFSIDKDTAVSLSKDGNQLSPYGNYDGPVPELLRSKPVAVITNLMTNSSGELTRLALGDNMPTVKIFGTETGPTASTNATFNLFDGNVFNLMVSRVFNNHNTIVPLRLPVDEEVRDNLETSFHYETDTTINAAGSWLKSLPECNRGKPYKY